jgi:hypothetical protein
MQQQRTTVNFNKRDRERESSNERKVERERSRRSKQLVKLSAHIRKD